MKPLLKIAALSAALILAGCASVGPNYHEVKPEAPQLQGLDAAQESNAQFQAAWWKQFNDPTLDALIQRAAANNLDLRMAVARLHESRALLSSSKSDQLPTVDTDLDYTRARGQEPGFTNQRTTVTTYQAGFDASWEVDLFGGVRRSVEAAGADLGASEAALHDAQVSLLAEVARNYFELRGSQLRLDIAQRDIDNQQQTVHLTEVREQLGSGSEQDVASAKAQLSAVQAQLPLLQTQVSASEFRLAVLLGERPGELDIDVSPKSFTPIAVSLPIGDAGDVLARRPDVRVAEREYAAATARIGVAKADFFPHIMLGGFLGFLAGSSNDFGGPSTRAWSLAPSISWPGLNIQRVRANLHASEARADAAQANYQQTVLLAIEDIDNAVTGFNQQRVRVDHLLEQSTQSKRAADLARVRYQEGATSFLELLDAERTQLAAEDDLAQGEAAINTRAVALYKALGGGWQACGDEHCSAVGQRCCQRYAMNRAAKRTPATTPVYRVALVSGANRGIGFEVARQLSERGMTVLLGARDLDEGRHAARQLTGAAGEVIAVQLDVTRQGDVDALARWIDTCYGRLDVLVNNAGGHYDHEAAASTPDLASARNALDTNLFGAWRLSSAMLPLMRKHGYGRIVNISSGCATASSGSKCVAYRTSKAALNAYTRTLAAELAGSGIVVNAVCPGWVATELGGPGGRPVDRGAAGIVWAASLPVPAPTGRFFRDGEVIPW